MAPSTDSSRALRRSPSKPAASPPGPWAGLALALLLGACSAQPEAGGDAGGLESASIQMRLDQAYQALESGDLGRAEAIALPLAEEGSPSGQFLAGRVFEGLSERDELPEADRATHAATARDWYQRAGEQEFTPAQVNLALMLLTGRGGESEPNAAHDWLKRAALRRDGSGEARAQFLLGEWYRSGSHAPVDAAESLYWYRLAAGQGEPRAQWMAGRLILAGKGTEADPRAAAAWFESAAAQRFAPAQAELARLYLEGNGVLASESEALRLLNDAADQGDLQALNQLGQLYAQGRAVDRDPQVALRYFERAADEGFAPAQANAGLMRLRGDGVPADEAAAVRWFGLAAEQGDRTAMVRLANLMARGRGTEVDLVGAAGWYQVAAALGQDDGESRLVELQKSLSEEQVRAAADWADAWIRRATGR